MEALALNPVQRFKRENYRPPCVLGNMQMARRRPPQSGCRGLEMGGERPQSCLGTGTAHQGARGVSPQRGAPQGASRLGSKTARSWKTSTRVAVISQHPSCPWPLQGLRFSLRTSSPVRAPQLRLGFFSPSQSWVFGGQWFLWCLESFQFGGSLPGRSRFGHLGNVSGVQSQQ